MNISSDIKANLLKYTDEICNKREFLEIHTSNDKDSKKIGNTQYRALANMALASDCFEELELYIKYKQAKGNGWNESFNGKKYGDVIVEYMGKIRQDVKDKEELSKALSLFFGYMYWQTSYKTKGGNTNVNNNTYTNHSKRR
jgi:hypothetical protein